MKKEVKKWPALSLTEKQKYLNDLLINDNKFKRHYNEAVKYFNIVKKDLNSIIFSSYDDVDINLFLENKLGEVLIEYFSKLVQFENVDNSEKLYNTLYYLSFEYIKIVKKDKQRQLIIDSHLPDLKVLVDLFSKQALNKNTFSKFSFNDLSLKTIIGFLVENNIRIYQTEGKTISKEESEATIVYSLIDLYMTSKLENVFLVEHLEDYRQLVTDTLKIQEEIGIKEKELKEFFSRIIKIKIDIKTIKEQIDKINRKSEIFKNIFCKKKLLKQINDYNILENIMQSLTNQENNYQYQIKNLKNKLVNLNCVFEQNFNNDLLVYNQFYQTKVELKIDDFNDKSKLKHSNNSISADVIRRLRIIGITIDNTHLSIDDFVNLKELISNYKNKFSNKNVCHQKIVTLLDNYGRYLKK